jgi:hypothetical protein
MLAVRLLEVGVSCWLELSKEKLFLTDTSAAILSSKRLRSSAQIRLVKPVGRCQLGTRSNMIYPGGILHVFP